MVQAFAWPTRSRPFLAMAPKKGHVPKHVKGQRNLFGGTVGDSPLPAALLTPSEAAVCRLQKQAWARAAGKGKGKGKRAAGKGRGRGNAPVKGKGKGGGMDWGRVCMLSWGW